MTRRKEMLFSRRLLLVLTPIGVVIGLHEAWRLAGGLVVLMAAQMLVLTLVMVGLVRIVRRETAQSAGDAPSVVSHEKEPS